MTEEHLNAPNTNDPTPTTQLPEHELPAETEAEALVEGEAGPAAEADVEALADETQVDQQFVYLPDPEDSPFFRGGPAPELELPTEDFPTEQGRFATESWLRRERQNEQEAAMASLDETVFRPLVTPIDFEPAGAPSTDGSTASNASAGGTPSPNRFSWRKAGVAAVIAAIALAVGIRAAGSRQSNVGLFGVVTPAEQGTPKFSLPSLVAPVATEAPEAEEDVAEEVVEEEEPAAEEEPTAEETSEEWVPEEQTYEDESTGDSYDQPESHTFTWTFSDPTGDGSGDEANGSDGYDDTSGYYSYNNYYDSWDDTDDSSTNDGSTYNDDRSVSLNFDGGNVTYYYDDRTVTLDWDVIDEIERYLDTYDSWGYGSPGGEQGYGSGYGSRTHDRDPGYYYFGW